MDENSPNVCHFYVHNIGLNAVYIHDYSYLCIQMHGDGRVLFNLIS